MSYILDALKRADAERERGSVPGLHAQPVPLAEARLQRTSGGLTRWLVPGVGLAVALLAVLAWRMTARQEVVKPATPTIAATIAAPIVAPIVAPVAAPIALPVAPAVAPRPAPVPAPAPPSKVLPEARDNVKTQAPAPAAAAAPAADSRIPSLAELPDDVRRQLPTLSISGSIYSDNPAQRLLTIGSQVFQEGDKPAPDVVLEQIRPKSAVFSYKGTRYSVAY